jgi:hypothetical protein
VLGWSVCALRAKKGALIGLRVVWRIPDAIGREVLDGILSSRSP